MLNLNLNAKYKIKTSRFGNSLQDYEIYGLLGKGGFSEVYRAKCFRTNQEIAIKMINKQVIKNEGLFDRISQEINIQSELDHPSILKLYTAFDDADHVCIVLELCSNGELLKYINKNSLKAAFSEKQAKVVIRQLVDGLEYLHSKNILHRDIKLANILLTDKMQIKIADFGLATRLMYPGECHLTMCGTPNYISPEIVSRKTHGPEVDLWSLGCLLYTLLVGKPPFETDTVKSTLNRVVAGDYRMPPDLSTSARDLINRLLQKNPQKRMTLQEIRDHPFISDDYFPFGQKWISNDSGFDTCTASSNYLSSRFHSLDRKQPLGNSNGYYSFDTPKSSRRSRSQDRKLLQESPKEFHNDMIQMMSENDFLVDSDSCDRIGRNYAEPLFTKKLTNNIEFSPVQRRVPDPAKLCEVFYENEILDRGNCNCSKCQSNKSCENMKLAGQKKDAKNRVRVDSGPKKLQFVPKGKSEPCESTPAGFSSESDESEDRVKVLPFTTERLKTMRHRLRNTIFSIVESGEVCVEFLRNKSKSKEIVAEVMRISKNGLKMFIYYPNKGRGVPPTDHPPPLPLSGADAVFNCETLSKENWKKYSYAARFVEMVQSKTPKLTLYTNKARCVLMENRPEPDFEIIYYDGAKITKSRKGIKLTDNNGVISILDDTGQESSKHLVEYYKFFKQCYDHCCLIEKQLAATSLSTSGTIFKVFPAILGKKPSLTERESEWNCIESPNLFHSTKYTT